MAILHVEYKMASTLDEATRIKNKLQKNDFVKVIVHTTDEKHEF